MDPIVLATLTSALTLISTEVGKGVASEAGKDLWTQIKSMFGWVKEPKAADLAREIASQLENDKELASKVLELLQMQPENHREASAFVQNIDAKNLIYAGVFNVGRDFIVK
jgi:hypothetical protein